MFLHLVRDALFCVYMCLVTFVFVFGTAQQAELRFSEIFLDMPAKYLTMRRSWRALPSAYAARAGYWNTMIMVPVDIILGVIAAYYLNTFATNIVVYNHQVWQLFEQNVMANYTNWLMGYPAGFKLNDNLDRWLGTICLEVLSHWDATVSTLIEPLAIVLVRLTALCGLFGLSFIICLVSDLASLATLHIFFMYTVAAKLYSVEIQAIAALSRLFRGQKWNVLRKRIDSCEYDIDQLLLGTLLFTLAVFLMPTIAVYYVFFMSVRISISLLNGCLSAVVALLNHFPVFPLALHLIFRRQLPGDLHFRVAPPDSAAELDSEALAGTYALTQSYFLLHTHKFPISGIFYKYKALIGNIFNHHTPLRILSCLLQGIPVPPAPTFQFAPTHGRQASLLDFWLFIKVYAVPTSFLSFPVQMNGNRGNIEVE
eukprot:TRINITY_DN6132_c0_g1_i2.p1 TRINITY_DN6132_c0_g1~~TRINITY_DN6132_c0_g1_i2.p1  ORF type:complete len:426 (+),score=70.43 TRINITY_DN6132_c0_g1_i2:794-2071(+)